MFLLGVSKLDCRQFCVVDGVGWGDEGVNRPGPEYRDPLDFGELHRVGICVCELDGTLGTPIFGKAVGVDFLSEIRLLQTTYQTCQTRKTRSLTYESRL
jgi:hypothetical protein